VLYGLITFIALINVLIPVVVKTLDKGETIAYALYISVQFLLLILLIFAFFRLNQSSKMYKFTKVKNLRLFLFAILSLTFVKMLFVILKLSCDIFENKTITLFIGGSGILFIYEAAIYIWIKNYTDIL